VYNYQKLSLTTQNCVNEQPAIFCFHSYSPSNISLHHRIISLTTKELVAETDNANY